MSALTFFACWYEMTRNDNNIIHYYEAIEASNSLWLHREKWCNQGLPGLGILVVLPSFRYLMRLAPACTRRGPARTGTAG